MRDIRSGLGSDLVVLRRGFVLKISLVFIQFGLCFFIYLQVLSLVGAILFEIKDLGFLSNFLFFEFCFRDFRFFNKIVYFTVFDGGGIVFYGVF